MPFFFSQVRNDSSGDVFVTGCVIGHLTKFAIGCQIVGEGPNRCVTSSGDRCAKLRACGQPRSEGEVGWYVG